MSTVYYNNNVIKLIPQCRILLEKLMIAHMTKKLHISANLKSHHCVSNSLLLDPILSQLNLVYIKLFNSLPSSLKSLMYKKGTF
jgi:hypothetical protein